MPGLNPLLSDLCIMAAAEGMTHQTLITEILYLAAERYHLGIKPDLPVRNAYFTIDSQVPSEQAQLILSTNN